MLIRDLASLLTDDLLELCLVGCAKESRGSLRLVCKRFKRLCDGNPVICKELRLWLSAGGQRRSRAALERVARLPFCEAHIGLQVPGALQALPLLTGLTTLTLGGGRHDGGPHAEWGWGSTFGTSLAALVHLQRLDLDMGYCQPGTCAQLAALTTLRQLCCGTFDGELPGELWASLACMPVLEQLTISAQTWDTCVPGEAWQALQACTQLSYLALRHDYLGSDERGFFRLEPGIAALTSLRHVWLQAAVSCFGDLWSHPTLASLYLEDAHGEEIEMPAAEDVCMPALRELSFECHCGPPPDVPHQLTRLSAVTSLSLCVGEPHPAAEHYWQLPSVVSLDLSHCKLAGGELPESVLFMTRLRALNLGNLGLAELPEGPYLDGLRTLLLDCNELTRLPPVLQRAKQLEVLDLFQSPCQDHPGVHLELGDLGLLCGMPLLRLLCVPGRDLPSWRIALLFRTWLPRLSCECHHSAASLDSLFPSGWDNGMDEAVFAERLEADRVNSLAVSGSVLRTLGRWLA